jgi:Transglycosylase SLT domain
VLRSRKLLVAAISVVSVLGVQLLALVPTASAEECTVTVTLVTGQTLTFNVNVAPGTPISDIPLPVKGAVAHITETCQTSPTTTTTTSTTTSGTTTTTTTTSHSTTTTSSTTTTTSTHTSTGGGHKGGNGGHKGGNGGHKGGNGGHKGGNGGHKGGNGGHKGGNGGHKGSSGNKKRSGGSGNNKKKTSAPKPPRKTTKKGVPTSSNPTFSFSTPGAAPIGVPNFFIDSFRIPPFLLPIYQAAGIQYDVPWQVLAAINEIETDYGLNLSVSSAGAVGWMQFMPATWKEWGVDANGDGVADPYNPVDAIFTAARYLHAAGASKNLSQAIFAYNHADWYVQSVLLRAKLIGGMPNQLIGALTGLVEGHFPVAAPAKYADSSVEKLAKTKVKGANAAIPIQSTSAQSVSIFAKQNSPAIAANDGKILKLGDNAQLGRYLELQDSTGNIYTYAHLGSIPKLYPVPKPVKLSAAELTQALSAPALPAPTQAASAGQQKAPSPTSTARATSDLKKNAPVTLPVTSGAKSQAQTSPVMVKERLFADPRRPASFAAGGALQVKNTGAEIANFRNYFSDVLHLGKNQYTLEPLKVGSIVVAGTILGRIAQGTKTMASHMVFMIQPAGKHAPYIDPKPVLDGWKLLEATAVYRAAGVDPFFGPGAKNATIGQILLMSKEQLQNRVLADPKVNIYSCGRRDIQAGLIDRRVLATIEFLSASGLEPTVDGLRCNNTVFASTSSATSGQSGTSVDISKINKIPIQGHTGAGSITDITVRRLLTLQGAMRPDEIISAITYKGQSNTMVVPDHRNEIQVTFTPLFGSNSRLSKQIGQVLQPGQWTKLINHISQIPEPVVPIAPSKYAIRPH